MNLTIHRQSVIQFYGYFALGIAFLFLGFYLFEEKIEWWQPDAPKVLPIILGGYLALSIIILQHSKREQAFSIDGLLPFQMMEILTMGLLMIYVAPKQQDLALLLLFHVGIGNLLVSKTYGYLLASMATIMVLTQGYLHPINAADRLLSGTFICISFFIEALIIQTLSSSLSAIRDQAQHTQTKLDSAAKLNDLIIERMHTGVCVVNHRGQVLRINRAAQEKLATLKEGDVIPVHIFERLKYWLEYNLQNDSDIQLDPSNPNSTAFVFFANIDESSALIFIENKETVVRKAHQFKLNSLARMAASIAHEIRNPLNAISHATQLLLENPNLNKEDQRLCDIILNHSDRMEGIVQNVMQISKRNSSELKWIQLDKWIEPVANDLENEFNCHIQLNMTPLEIRFDPSQLRQVLTNLTQNATRYGNAMETGIEITFHGESKRPYLSFMDHGSGLNQQAQEYLYEPFYSTSASGTGLGLYLVKELCEANHAEIRYDTQYSQGAKFDIYFAYEFAKEKDTP